ncbi:MAG: RtcB family protein [Candidatus Korarchaeota archaeon]
MSRADIRSTLRKIGTHMWEIPPTARDKMRVRGLLFANETLLNEMEDEAIYQLTNVATLPGMVDPVVAMPDAHTGYGLPVGAIGASDHEEGIVSAGMTGFDINCGIRVLSTNLTVADVKPVLERLINQIFHDVPSGVGSTGAISLSMPELDELLETGAYWAYEHGYGIKEDVERIEENGRLKGANSDAVSSLAKKRGKEQIGTLGAGNHFLEIQKVDRIYEPEIAKRFGITHEGQITVMVHTGSRGLGHQVATDYLREMEQYISRNNIWLPDKQLVYAPAKTQIAERYLQAMRCAANYAFANRSMITHWIRHSFEKVMGRNWESMGLKVIYDVTHNICKEEEHVVNGEKRMLYVHRKGATRAFPAGHPDVQEFYRDIGQPVLIAGSMGTASYILVGTKKAMELAYGSTCHGSGRVKSRTKAMKDETGREVLNKLRRQGIIARATDIRLLSEESPSAYKNVDEVVRTVHEAGVSRMIVRLVPIAVAKG